jgi:MFS family permease
VAGRRFAAGVSATAVLVGALDAYVVVTILVAIASDFAIPINRLERATPLVTGYLLGYIAAMPLLGRLSDRFGRRSVLQSCLAGFAVGSIVSAAAPSFPLLVVGRLIQGAAGGALLPVSFALIGDLWEPTRRAVPLGLTGAVQELGSVLGPLYGAGVAAALGWRGVFWLNVPLAAVAMGAVHRVVPGARQRPAARVPVAGGLLLTASLAVLVVGLYNPDPARSVLPPWGPWMLIAGAAGLILFAMAERQAASPLIERDELHAGPFAVAMTVSFLSGAALMATLVDIPLLAQTLLGKGTVGGALVLTRFLVALPVGAVVGGILVRTVGERLTAFGGLTVAALGYWLVSRWPVELAAARHSLGFGSIPRMDTDLVVSGLGLGLAIAPVASMALRSTAPSQHGVASAAAVVTRMIGMLVGIAALAAWGLHRFQELTAGLTPPVPFGLGQVEFARKLAVYAEGVREALHVEYGEIFQATAVICAAGAIVASAMRPPKQPRDGLVGG